MKIWYWLTRSHETVIPNWTEARSKDAETRTYRYLGIRPEPIYTWSRRLRPKAKLKAVTEKVAKMPDRKRA